MVTKSRKQKVLTKEEEEAKSQAYINKLLAQEQEAEDIYSLNYYEGYGNSLADNYQYNYEDFDDDYDDDYEYSRYGKNNKKNRRKNNNDDEDYEMNSRSNKKKVTAKKPALPKKRPVDESNDDSPDETKHRKINNPLGTYTPEEEAKFLEGINLYGRDWKNLTNHIGTRNSKSVRSHAQKYFIKLYREAKPLPDKVKESGEGYTLSGKPLDPYSASAKPYLANVDIKEIEKKLAKFNGNGYGIANNEITEVKTLSNEKENKTETNDIKKSTEENSNDIIMEEMSKDKNEKQKEEKKNESNDSQKKPITITIKKDSINGNNNKKENNKKGNSNKKSHSKSKDTFMESIQVDEDGRTLYSKQRPKRSTAVKNLSYKEFMDTSNPLTMVKCESYFGVPGSGTPGSQPFSIIVNPVALATMDLHAHLVKTEVIGLLAGEWNLEEKKLYVLSAYPCRSIENDDGNTSEVMNRHVNVEMDPVGEFEIRSEINKLNMKVVGWYHSHPKFAPDPSFVDIENQLNYQTLFREKNNVDEPFVGVIVGPYDPRLPRSYSAVNWFYVANQQEEFGHPKHLITETEWINNDKNNIPVKEYEKMKTLIDSYKDHKERHIFSETWKQNLNETKLEKVIKSLSYQLQLLNSNNTIAQSNDQDNKNDIDLQDNTKQDDIIPETTTNVKNNHNENNTDNAVNNDNNNQNNNNNVTEQVTENTNIIDDYNFDSDSELSDISTISSDISSLDGIQSDDKMDVSFDPNTENKKIQIKVTNDKKKINENTVNTGKKESEGKKQNKSTTDNIKEEQLIENSNETNDIIDKTDKMEIEEKVNNEEDKNEKQVDMKSNEFYDGVNLLKMVEQELQKWNDDNIIN